jgi:hypothetical protein
MVTPLSHPKPEEITNETTNHRNQQGNREVKRSFGGQGSRRHQDRSSRQRQPDLFGQDPGSKDKVPILSKKLGEGLHLSIIAIIAGIAKIAEPASLP